MFQIQPLRGLGFVSNLPKMTPKLLFSISDCDAARDQNDHPLLRHTSKTTVSQQGIRIEYFLPSFFPHFIWFFFLKTFHYLVLCFTIHKSHSVVIVLFVFELVVFVQLFQPECLKLMSQYPQATTRLLLLREGKFSL